MKSSRTMPSYKTKQLSRTLKTSATVLAAPLAASILLTGCGGDPKPSTSPPSTTSSSPTSDATPKPTKTASPTSTAGPKTDPNIPAAARAHTIAGAEAFVKYFFQRSNEAWTGPHAGILAPLCQTSAIACTELERDATRLVREGHRYNGNPVTVKFIGATDAPSPNRLDVLANLVQERRSEVDAAGKIYVTDKRKNLRLHFGLLYTDHSWSVATMKIMQ